MTLRSAYLPLLLGITLCSAAAQAGVIVTFNEPDKFVDAGVRRGEMPEIVAEIERHLSQLGRTYLGSDQTLRIDVLDIDLAGEDRFRPFAGTDIRVLKGRADWPSIQVRYVLESAGKAGEARDETISDKNYLMHPIIRPERLAYEKRMLDEWFKARFVRARDR